MINNCPFCKKKLWKYDYSDYWNPPEYGEECINTKCRKYYKKYCYGLGFDLKCGKWKHSDKTDWVKEKRMSDSYLEFIKRVNYQLKRK
ncbi:hypothetical protein [Clostridium perfringens]|jgi:hypothetical protein|uniref:Phage protein n=1 Tax=Clostridium perfringens TaxID=1502 RepID=A0AAW4IXZ5_CLOPF|nr:hypothetical protein [Clostridium perfringens]MBO3356176.1 hypothetical protein [Clostridium perfringens]MBO3359483.1 hypothetical protein [Clostridium perfringens]